MLFWPPPQLEYGDAGDAPGHVRQTLHPLLLEDVGVESRNGRWHRLKRLLTDASGADQDFLQPVVRRSGDGRGTQAT